MSNNHDRSWLWPSEFITYIVAFCVEYEQQLWYELTPALPSPAWLSVWFRDVKLTMELIYLLHTRATMPTQLIAMLPAKTRPSPCVFAMLIRFSRSSNNKPDGENETRRRDGVGWVTTMIRVDLLAMPLAITLCPVEWQVWYELTLTIELQKNGFQALSNNYDKS